MKKILVIGHSFGFTAKCQDILVTQNPQEMKTVKEYKSKEYFLPPRFNEEPLKVITSKGNSALMKVGGRKQKNRYPNSRR